MLTRRCRRARASLEARAAPAAAVGDAASQQGSDFAEALRLYRAMGAEGHVARLAE
jgi:hypothetical protein